MEFISLVENFKKGINIGERVSGKNFTLPILSNLLLSTNKNKLIISATDLEIGLEIEISGKVEEEGKVTIPAKHFANFLNNLSEEKIILKSKEKENVVKIKSGDYEINFQSMPVDDFPIIPEIKTESYLELNLNTLKESLEQVIPSSGYSSVKPELNSVLIDFEESVLKFVATDSFRLAEKTLKDDEFQSILKENKNIIIPLKTAQEVLRISQENLENISPQVKIFSDPNQILFSFGSARLVSRLIEGNYPKYANIIPKEFSTQIIIPKKELIEAVKISGLFSGKINDIRFKINPQKKEVIIEAHDPSLGESQIKIIPQEINGEPLEISFNYRYVLDGLNSLREEIIFWGFNQELNPCLMRGARDKSFFYILMPIKL